MKRMFKLLIVMFILYFGLQYLYYYLGKGHNITYTLVNNNNQIVVEEEMTYSKNISDGYFFNIKFDGYSIPFKVLKKYNKQKRIVSNVDIYYGDSYVCALIKLKKDDNISDIKCIKDDIIYFYSSIRGKDTKLDNLVDQSDYEILRYRSDTQSFDKDKIKYYPNNYIDDYVIALGYYKGLYLFGNSILSNTRFITLFTNDQYAKEIEGLVDNYYIVADYNSSHEFLNFYAINISTGNSITLVSKNEISFNSYIEGSYNGKLYLIDIQNKKQYEINPKKKEINLIGDENSGALVYTKEGWITKNINEVIDNKIRFYDNLVDSIDGQKYDNLKLIGNEYGIYYYFNKNGSLYDAYMIYAQDKNQTRHYLFSSNDINRIKFIDDNVFYINDDEIKVYGPRTGIRTILKFNELKYNSNLKFYVY